MLSTHFFCIFVPPLRSLSEMGKGVRKVYAMFQAAGCRDVTLKLYPGLRHEILNEGPMRQTVYEDIWHWLEPHLPAR